MKKVIEMNLNVLKRYGWIVAVLVVSLIFFISVQKKDSVSKVSLDQSPVAEQEETASPAVMMVDVKGEVSKPGVYQVEQGMRVDDVICMAGGMTSEADSTSVNLAQVLVDEMVILVGEMGVVVQEGSSSLSEQLSINQATAEELQTLNGIGPSKADAIIQYREEHGPFQKIEDLLEVPGIGEATLSHLEESIRVP